VRVCVCVSKQGSGGAANGRLEEGSCDCSPCQQLLMSGLFFSHLPQLSSLPHSPPLLTVDVAVADVVERHARRRARTHAAC
jgi:hypothetical protein